MTPPSFAEWPIEFWITVGLILFALFVIFYVLSIWIYKRAPANMAFIRTGLMGTKVCLGRGAIVLPVFHDVTWVSLETMKVIVSRSREQAVLSQDKIRLDVVAELYTHVGYTKDDILRASRSLGEKTFDSEKVRNLLEAKVVSALRSHAATKSLNEMHENRDDLATQIKADVIESFRANGLFLEEVTIVTLEQAGKEYFKTDNVFDAEGLKIITDITSAARRDVHNTEKKTAVAIRQRDLDTQLELLEIEKKEAVARADQDKAVSNEQALQLSQKQMYILEQRKAVEEKEIETDKALEKMRTQRDLAFLEEAKRRETAEVQKTLFLEQEQKDRQIALIGKDKEEELTNIQRSLAKDSAEKDREIQLTAKERERQQAEIDRVTAIAAHEEKAREERHKITEQTALAMRRQSVETRLASLEVEKEEALAAARQEREVANERADIFSEQQRFILEKRWEVEEEEIQKSLALEKAKIKKDVALSEELKGREAAEIKRALARDQEERERQIAIVSKDETLERARVTQTLAVELEERTRDIALIKKETERERVDIQRFLARELEERDRQIAMAQKTADFEKVEIERLQATTLREKAQHEMESVRLIADAERAKEIEKVDADALAETRQTDERSKAEITRMHMVTQAEARKGAAEREAEATILRAQANSDAQKIIAEGLEREAGARGRAEMEIETLRAATTQRMLEAEASGIEAKAGALKKYNDAATYLELAKMQIEADRDVHIDQAKAMANALQGAQIRMFGGDNGTVDTLRSLFTSGFGLGEALEGVAQSLPAGLRQRFAQNGLRGIWGRPYGNGNVKERLTELTKVVNKSLGSKQARQIPFAQGVSQLEEQAGDDSNLAEAIGLLKEVNQHGLFNDVPFEKVWSLVQAGASKEAEKEPGEDS